VKRTALMREHVKDVSRDIVDVRDRSRGAREALEREKHLAMLDAMNRERAAQETRVCEKETELQNEQYREYSRRAEAYEAAMGRLRARAESAGVVRDIVRERVDDDERDLETLKMYEIEDERLLQTLEFELGKASKDAHESQSELEHAMSLQAAVQCELLRVGKTLKEAHVRRAEFQEEYTSACTTLSERQGLIQKTACARDEIVRDLEDKRAAVSELVETTKRAELENKSLRSKSTVKEQLSKRKTEKCQALKGDLTTAAQALETATHMRVAAARSAECARNRRCEAEVALKSHLQARDDKCRQVERAKRALEEARSALMTSEQSLQELHNVHDAEAANLAQAQKTLDAEKELLFQTSKTLHDQKDVECRLGVELHGVMMHSKNLRETESTLRAKIIKQHELMYATSLQFQQLDRKTARLEGVRSNEEKEALEARIESLQKDLAERKCEFARLVIEAKSNEQKLERSRIEMVTWCDKATYATQTRDLMEVEAEGSERLENSMLNEYEIAQVELDELRLQLCQRRQVLYLCDGQTQELVKRKNSVIDELSRQRADLREQNIAAVAQGNTLQQEAHAAIMDAKRLEQRLDHLRSRYAVVRKKSLYGEDVSIDEQNDYLQIISDQREQIDVERLNLLECVRAAEASVDTMENVLEDTERSNGELRYRLIHPNENKELAQDEWTKTTEILEKLQIENDAVARLRERESELARALEKLKSSLAEIVAEHNEVSIDVDDAQRNHDAMHRKYRSQKHKLKRAKSLSSAAVAAYRAAAAVAHTDGPTYEEKKTRAHLLNESIREASEIIRAVASKEALKIDTAFDGESTAPSLSPTSSLASFFTFASSTTQSVASSMSSLLSN